METKNNKESTKSPPRILFISRAYPPIIGGIENQNFELSRWLSKYAKVKTIANTRGKKWLPIFFPVAMLKILFSAHNYDIILFGDGVLGIIAWLTKTIYPKKTIACVVHGLDLTYTLKTYQKFWVQKFIPSCDILIAVGKQTVTEGIKRQIPEEKFTFIPNGVSSNEFSKLSASRKRLAEITKRPIENKKILLTSGRLARRKGVAWFIRNVLPKLDESYHYVVAGDGPDREHVQTTIKETHQESKVTILGRVSDTIRGTLLASADVFIQANIPIKGDMEGFGISVIEAGAAGQIVLASRLEGLKDAIVDKKNGLHVESGNPEDWKQKIEMVFGDAFNRTSFKRNTQEFVQNTYDWSIIAKKYIEVLTQKNEK